MAEQPYAPKPVPLDPVTIVAIAALVYCLSINLHENLGHGLTAYLVGVKPSRLASVYVTLPDGAFDDLSPGRVRAILAAGTLVQVGIFGLAWLTLAKAGARLAPVVRYGLWLALAVDGFMGFGYAMTSPFMGYGDWFAFAKTFDLVLPWKIGITLAGLWLSFKTLELAMRELEPFAGNGADRPRRFLSLTLLPYVTGCIAVPVAASLDRVKPDVARTSAVVSTLFGTCWLLILLGKRREPRPDTPLEPLGFGRSWATIGLALGVLAVYVGVFGTGIDL